MIRFQKCDLSVISNIWILHVIEDVNVFVCVQENMPYGTCEKRVAEPTKLDSNLMMIAKLTADATKPTQLGLSVFVVIFVSLLSFF